MKDWDTLYKTEKNPFGAEPSLLIKNYLHLFPKDYPILDLGCGDGRNALLVAKEGFNVICVDISPVALDNLVSRAKEMGLNDKIQAINMDAAKFKFDKKFGVVICYTTLHFLLDRDARRVIKEIKNNTIQDGLNIIADFAGEGPLKRNNDYFWFKNDELKSLYSGWEVLLYQEELSKTKATDESGSPFMQNIARLVAQNTKK